MPCRKRLAGYLYLSLRELKFHLPNQYSSTMSFISPMYCVPSPWASCNTCPTAVMSYVRTLLHSIYPAPQLHPSSLHYFCSELPSSDFMRITQRRHVKCFWCFTREREREFHSTTHSSLRFRKQSMLSC